MFFPIFRTPLFAAYLDTIFNKAGVVALFPRMLSFVNKNASDIKLMKVWERWTCSRQRKVSIQQRLSGIYSAVVFAESFTLGGDESEDVCKVTGSGKVFGPYSKVTFSGFGSVEMNFPFLVMRAAAWWVRGLWLMIQSSTERRAQTWTATLNISLTSLLSTSNIFPENSQRTEH